MPSNAATTAAIYNLKLYGRLFAFAPRLRSCVRAHRILQFIILFLEKIKQKIMNERHHHRAVPFAVYGKDE